MTPSALDPWVNVSSAEVQMFSEKIYQIFNEPTIVVRFYVARVEITI